MSDLQQWLDSLLQDGQQFASAELRDLLRTARADSQQFIRQLAELTEQLIQQRALGELTNDEFRELMGDLLDLKQMQLQKLSVAAQARAQHIANGLQELVLNRLLLLI